MTKKPLGTKHLRLRIRQNLSGQATVVKVALASLIQDLFVNLEFHTGHIKLNVGSVQ
jgi:hypothetical protein